MTTDLNAIAFGRVGVVQDNLQNNYLEVMDSIRELTKSLSPKNKLRIYHHVQKSLAFACKIDP